jgi:hypothetical protein
MLFSFRHDCGCELTFRQQGDGVKFDQRFTCRQHKNKPRFQIPRSGSDFVSYTLECGCAYLRDTRVFTCSSCRSLSSPPMVPLVPVPDDHPCHTPKSDILDSVPDNHAYHAARKPSIMAIAICALCGQQTLPDGTCHCGATPVRAKTTAPVTQCVTEQVTFTEEERGALIALVEVAYSNAVLTASCIVSIPKASRSSSWAQHLAMADNELAALTAVRDKVKKL